MPYKIMIAEDDEDIAELIALYLENDDFHRHKTEKKL